MSENSDKLDEKSVPELRDIAAEHGIEGRSEMKKGELIEAIRGTDYSADTEGLLYGPQSGIEYPLLPQTREDFQKMMPNPDLPPERQAAPTQQDLNPHLFPNRLRY